MKGDEFLKSPTIVSEWWIFKKIHHPTTILSNFQKEKEKKEMNMNFYD